MVSIIVPVYMVSDYVERCIRSVMAQSYTNIECIIVDDATEDDSIVKCKRLINDYNGPISFRIICHERNLGLSAARNTGTKAATGEYIYYIDSDDEMTPDCIEKLMNVLDEYPEAEIVVGNTQVIEKGKNDRVWLKEETPCLIQGNETIADYYHQRLIPNAVWNKLIKSSFIEEHDLYCREGIIHEDILWMFYVVKYLSAVYLVKDVTSYYHIRQGSISTATDDYTEGTNYRIIFDDMLCHLTAGREDKELIRYVKDFCKCYLRYKAYIPEYKQLYRLYWDRAKEHRCSQVYKVLAAVGIIGCFKKPIHVFERLNNIRCKMRRLVLKY